MRIFLDTIGCRLNQSEIEKIAAQFESLGHTIVPGADQADLVVVNTCSVTAAAASDSRQKIRQAYRAGAADIVVTGCWATLAPDKAAELPGVSHIILNQNKDALLSEVLHLPEDTLPAEHPPRKQLPGVHARTRAFIKAQDGCDNYCTFCITRIARGKGRSVPLMDVLADVKAAQANGVKEVVLSGVHLGSWGKDLQGGGTIYDLINQVLEQTTIPRIRLSSIEPWGLDDKFFSLWKDERLCPHFHLPLQSGSANILKRMARKTTPQKFSALVALIRSIVPRAAITTDIIVGFPGETEQEFEESLDFVREMDFADGHVFPFSVRPGTPAAKYTGQIIKSVRKERGARMREVIDLSRSNYQIRFIGQNHPVLWESGKQQEDGSWLMTGLTGNYLRVETLSSANLWNQISPVRLMEITGRGFLGEIAEE
jgi:threonylcarbamoyladenosine tRNA methylthiotransferase MtaB